VKQNHANQRAKSDSLFDVKRHKIGESKPANWLISGANQAPSGIAPKTLTKGRWLISANPAWLERDAFFVACLWCANAPSATINLF
jgi:hypothetical protein